MQCFRLNATAGRKADICLLAHSLDDAGSTLRFVVNKVAPIGRSQRVDYANDHEDSRRFDPDE